MVQELTNLLKHPSPAFANSLVCPSRLCPHRTLHSHGVEEYKEDGSGEGICKRRLLLCGGEILPSRECRQPGLLWRKCPASKEVTCQMQWAGGRLKNVDMKCLQQQERSCVPLSAGVCAPVCMCSCVWCVYFGHTWIYSFAWSHFYQRNELMKPLLWWLDHNYLNFGEKSIF